VSLAEMLIRQLLEGPFRYQDFKGSEYLPKDIRKVAVFNFNNKFILKVNLLVTMLQTLWMGIGFNVLGLSLAVILPVEAALLGYLLWTLYMFNQLIKRPTTYNFIIKVQKLASIPIEDVPSEIVKISPDQDKLSYLILKDRLARGTDYLLLIKELGFIEEQDESKSIEIFSQNLIDRIENGK
jgi:hypothetical protein